MRLSLIGTLDCLPCDHSEMLAWAHSCCSRKLSSTTMEIKFQWTSKPQVSALIFLMSYLSKQATWPCPHLRGREIEPCLEAWDSYHPKGCTYVDKRKYCGRIWKKYRKKSSDQSKREFDLKVWYVVFCIPKLMNWNS